VGIDAVADDLGRMKMISSVPHGPGIVAQQRAQRTKMVEERETGFISTHPVKTAGI
jgi:hypothetical protein